MKLKRQNENEGTDRIRMTYLVAARILDLEKVVMSMVKGSAKQRKSI